MEPPPKRMKKSGKEKPLKKAAKPNKQPIKQQPTTEPVVEPEVDLADEAEVAAPDTAAKEEEKEEEAPKTFKELGVVDVLCEVCQSLGYTAPTPIQAAAIPIALQNRDLIGTAETGSGKTIAFVLPILQALLERPRPLFGLVLAPTRELAVQIGLAFDSFSSIAVRCTVVVGGMNMMEQSIALARKPHVVVATPGRLLDHLEKTKGFSLQRLQYLVIDEADRMLDMDFGPIVQKILLHLPRERRTMLFSATMSSKVESLQRASLRDPLRVSVSSGPHQTVSTLKQRLILTPPAKKDINLVYMLNEFYGRSTVVFTRTVYEAQRVAFLLRALGFGAIPLHGKLSQSARLSALNKIKSGSRNILVATDVAARGLDIPDISFVINYDLPLDSKTYVHRVGRTARAGKSGYAVSFVTQYDVMHFLAIEKAIGMERKIEKLEPDPEELMIFNERVDEAQRRAKEEMRTFRETEGNKKKAGWPAAGKRRRHDGMDREER